MISSHLDHAPILLSLTTVLENEEDRKGKCPFRFEKMWMHDLDCDRIVKATWRGVKGANGLADIGNEIKRLQDCISATGSSYDR